MGRAADARQIRGAIGFAPTRFLAEPLVVFLLVVVVAGLASAMASSSLLVRFVLPSILSETSADSRLK